MDCARLFGAVTLNQGAKGQKPDCSLIVCSSPNTTSRFAYTTKLQTPLRRAAAPRTMPAMRRNDSKPAVRLPLDEPIVRPTFGRERAAMRRGVFPVAGCDEAGRGPLAGPVVAAAVILDPRRIPKGLNDSKKLNAETRAMLYEKICASAQVAVAIAPPARIEADNIRGASLWALAPAVKALTVRPKLVFVDGIDR